MIMIPLPFLISIVAIYFLAQEILNRNERGLNGYFIAFLALLALQTTLIGVRFGYGVEVMGRIQPFTASLLPVLGFLSFARPKFKIGLVLCLFQMVVCLGLLIFTHDITDGFLAVSNLIYTAGLVGIGINSSVHLSWVKFNRLPNVKLALWLVAGLLFFNAIIDALIVWDFSTNQGTNLSDIVKYSTIIGIVSAIIMAGIWWISFKHEVSNSIEADRSNDKAVFARIEKLMKQEELFLDPDLNLNRIARKLTLPVRDISQAINGETGQNVSQYVNQLRILDASKRMAKTDASIIEILYANGFNTKSNFNREFSRVMGDTPSEWRKKNIETVSSK